MVKEDKKFMTLKQIKDRWQIPDSTLRDWMRRKLITPHQLGPRCKIYIDPLEIPTWFRGGTNDKRQK